MHDLFEFITNHNGIRYILILSSMQQSRPRYDIIFRRDFCLFGVLELIGAWNVIVCLNTINWHPQQSKWYYPQTISECFSNADSTDRWPICLCLVTRCLTQNEKKNQKSRNILAFFACICVFCPFFCVFVCSIFICAAWVEIEKSMKLSK